MQQEVWVRSIANTSGEVEREAKSRKFNTIEAFAVMTFCLAVLWLLQYPFGVLGKSNAMMTISTVILTLGALYLLFVSPFLHRDTLTSWGLGNPAVLWRTVRYGQGASRYATGFAAVGVIGGLAFIGYVMWPEVAKFLFGMKREAAIAFQASVGGKVCVAALVFVLAAFLGTFVIRYDNFVSAFFTAVKVLLLLGTLLYLLAYATMGTKAFADFNGPKFGLDVFGYVFWGALQQLLFSAYFGTRFRKGFAPAKAAEDIWKKRLLVSLLNGSFFGLIHINSWLLVLVCWILGVFLSWVFMEDRNRNLIALGFIHGFLGSSVGWLFSKGKAGHFEIDMGVGPTHIQGFDPVTAVLTSTLIIAFCAAMFYIARANWREE